MYFGTILMCPFPGFLVTGHAVCSTRRAQQPRPRAVRTGRTRPRSVISPVMATSEHTRRPLKSEARHVAMVTPADGPSLVTAPAGKCRWMSVLSRRSKLPEA